MRPHHPPADRAPKPKSLQPAPRSVFTSCWSTVSWQNRRRPIPDWEAATTPSSPSVAAVPQPPLPVLLVGGGSEGWSKFRRWQRGDNNYFHSFVGRGRCDLTIACKEVTTTTFVHATKHTTCIYCLHISVQPCNQTPALMGQDEMKQATKQ